MFETPEQIEELRGLMELSLAKGGQHLLSILTPDRRLSAEQVVTYLQGVKHLALATASLRAVPRVAPVDAHFLWGHFYFSSDGRSLRAEHMRANPEVSATHFVGDDVAITVHGRAVFLEYGSDEERRVEAHMMAAYGMSAYDLSDDIIIVRIDARRFFAFASHPENFPSSLPA